MDFKKVFSGFKEASPDGQLPKINQPGMDGMYEVTVLSHEGFNPKEQGQNALSFKMELQLDSASTGKIPVGQKCSILIHGLNADKDYIKAKHWGNFKAVLAACLGSLEGVEVSPLDQSIEWEEISEMVCRVKDTLAGARFRVQVNTERAGKEKNGNEYARMRFESLPKLGAAA